MSTADSNKWHKTWLTGRVFLKLISVISISIHARHPPSLLVSASIRIKQLKPKLGKKEVLMAKWRVQFSDSSIKRCAADRPLGWDQQIQNLHLLTCRTNANTSLYLRCLFLPFATELIRQYLFPSAVAVFWAFSNWPSASKVCR